MGGRYATSSFVHVRRKEMPSVIPLDNKTSRNRMYKAPGKPETRKPQTKRGSIVSYKGNLIEEYDDDDDDTPPPNLEKLREVRRQRLLELKAEMAAADKQQYEQTARRQSNIAAGEKILKEREHEVWDVKDRIREQEEALLVSTKEHQTRQKVQFQVEAC